MPKTKGTLLLVEDEPSLVLTLTDRLEAEGYAVTHAGSGEAALEAASERRFDLVLLDVMLPGIDGFDVCRTLRDRGNTAAILMLTARSQVVDKVVGLKLGADDYLTKPFEMAELTARLEVLLRRSQAGSLSLGQRVSFGEISIDLAGASVTRAGQRVDLSALEYKLLRYLWEHRGKVLSRGQLLDEVWGYESDVQSRTVDVHVGSLRQKIEEVPSKPQHIVTVHGQGYKLVV